MEGLNYHPLLYFWTVTRHGSIARATEELYLAQPTISAQLRALEEALGEKLFLRTGRNIPLTETGQIVLRYADKIFSRGRELTDTLKGRSVGRPVRFSVGVADVLPKLITYRLLQPALQLTDPIRMVCQEDKPERLLAELAVHGLDLVLSDAPIGPVIKVRAFNH
jgi:LysR family transcriptional regulator, transcriptional activator of nhaA